MTKLAQNWITSSTYMWIDIRSYEDSNDDSVGDIKGLISKLDYLEDLGIGVVMLAGLMPTDFAYAGTMITDFYNIDPKLGTLEDLDNLLKEAHKRGIAIMIVWAPYSTHPDHHYFQASRDPNDPEHKNYADYYTWADDLNTPLPHPVPRGTHIGHWEWDDVRKKYYHATWKTADGKRWCPETNPYSKKMREECEKVLRFWLEQGVDGLWFDCADKGDFRNYEDHTAFWKNLNKIIHSYPNKLSVSEDGTWVELTIGKEGFDQFKCGNQPIPVYETIYRSEGQGTLVVGPKGQEWYGIHEALISYYSGPKGNQCAKWYHLQKSTDFKNPKEVARTKQYYALALTLPIVPKFIMGMELGLVLNLPTESLSNHLMGPMMWDNTPNYSFTTTQPFLLIEPKAFPSTVTVETQLSAPDSILNCFRKLANLRKKNPALEANASIPESYAKIPTQDDKNYYAFLRINAKPGQRILALFNLKDTPQEIECNFEKTKHNISGEYMMRDIYNDLEESPLNSNKYAVSVPTYGFKILELKKQ